MQLLPADNGRNEPLLHALHLTLLHLFRNYHPGYEKYKGKTRSDVDRRPSNPIEVHPFHSQCTSMYKLPRPYPSRHRLSSQLTQPSKTFCTPQGRIRISFTTYLQGDSPSSASSLLLQLHPPCGKYSNVRPRDPSPLLASEILA